MSPFGAPHRVYLDTPSLKGNCPDTFVSEQIPRRITSLVSRGIRADTTLFERPEVIMSTFRTVELHAPKLRGRDRRALNLSTKLTTTEAKAIDEAAASAEKTPSEWAREVLLRAAVAKHEQLDRHIFTELVGLQMLLMGTLEPLLSGERLTREEIALRFRQVQKGKAAQADELLSRRTQVQEKQP